MHDSIRHWVFRCLKRYPINQPGQKLLDIGGRDVNGSCRGYFKNCECVTIDPVAAPGVDIVTDSHHLVETFGEAAFDIILCTSMLEHDSAFWVTMPQIGAVLRQGGHLLLSAVGFDSPNGPGWVEHCRPDYWRFHVDCVDLLYDLAKLELLEKDRDTGGPGFTSVGRKT